MSKHTPGPWEVTPAHYPPNGVDGERMGGLCDVAYRAGSVVKVIAENIDKADACLIAASPNLLATLERVELAMSYREVDWTAVRMAIKAARGDA